MESCFFSSSESATEAKDATRSTSDDRRATPGVSKERKVKRSNSAAKRHNLHAHAKKGEDEHEHRNLQKKPGSPKAKTRPTVDRNKDNDASSAKYAKTKTNGDLSDCQDEGRI